MNPSLVAPIDVVAPYYRQFSHDELHRLLVMAPYENKHAPGTWVRGNIRVLSPGNQSQDFVVTGPRMRILFGGCRWNKIVFASSPSDPSTVNFKEWLDAVSEVLKAVVSANPDKFRPGSKSSSRFIFDNDFFKPSSEPAIYADEIRMRIATTRQANAETGEAIDMPNVELFSMDENYNRTVVEPYQLQSGGYLVPLIKISYFRNLERFGLSLTVLKGLYIPPEPRMNRTREMELDLANVEDLDYPHV